MKTKIYEKKLIRRPDRYKNIIGKDGKKETKKLKGRIDVVENKDVDIKEYMIEGPLDFLWYLLNSSIPDQIPYCQKCLDEGQPNVKKDGHCILHRDEKLKYAFKEITKEQRETNIKFAKRASWLISTVCDASPKRFDDKKIVKGIIDINRMNHKLSLKSMSKIDTTNEKLNNILN